MSAPTFVYESKFEFGRFVFMATDFVRGSLFTYDSGTLRASTTVGVVLDFIVGPEINTFDVFGTVMEGADLKRFRTWLEQLRDVGYGRFYGAKS